MFQFIFQLWDFILQFVYSSFQQLLLRLRKFSLLFFCQYKFLHFLVENPLDVSYTLLVFWFVLVQHFFVHQDLLSQGLFYTITLLGDLAQSVLEQTVESLGFTHFAALLFNFFEVRNLSIENIVCKLAWSISKWGIGTLSKFFRR